MRGGCLGTMEISAAPSVNGGAVREGTDTEITGEVIPGLRYDKDELKQVWNITNLSLKVDEKEEAKAEGWPHTTPEKYRFDPTALEWDGWMYVGQVPETQEELSPPMVAYV